MEGFPADFRARRFDVEAGPLWNSVIQPLANRALPAAGLNMPSFSRGKGLLQKDKIWTV